MVNTKEWWKSKAVWAAIVTGVLGVISALGVPVPAELYALFGALGLYGLRTAKKDLK